MRGIKIDTGDTHAVGGGLGSYGLRTKWVGEEGGEAAFGWFRDYVLHAHSAAANPGDGRVFHLGQERRGSAPR